MRIRLFPAIVLIVLALCGCGNSVSSSSSTDSKTMNSGNSSSIVQSSEEDSSEKEDIDVESYSDTQFFLIDHARISYDPALLLKNDRPGDYFDIGSPYESYTYYEDGSPLFHEVFYKEGGYYTERWEQDENGNVTMFDGRTGSDRVVYIYDENNRLIQEWGHNTNYKPSSVTIYDEYDEHGNYGYSCWISGMTQYNLIKEGGTWYDLDSIVDFPEYRFAYYYSYEYDEAGRLTSVVRERYDGSGRSTHTYEYDSHGNLVYEYHSGDVYIREYHGNGEIAFLQKKWRDEIREETVYDLHGNPVKNINDGKLTTYENEYDKYGNLIRQYTYDEEGNCKYYDIWQYIDRESYLKDIDIYMDFID